MVHPILAKVRRYCKRANISEVSFGRYAAKDARIVSRLENGKPSAKVIADIEDWIRRNPPSKRPKPGRPRKTQPTGADNG